MVVVFAGVSEHCQSEFPSPAASGLISAEQESGKPVHLETELEEDPQAKAIDITKLPEQSTDISVEATSDTKPLTTGTSKGSSHSVSPKPRQRLLGLFRREKDKPAEIQSAQKEDVKMSKLKEPGNTQNLNQGAAHAAVGRPASVKPEAKPSETTKVRTVHLTALQNTPFKETETPDKTDPQQQATEGRAGQQPKRLSNLKAFWERENSGPKIIFTREEARRQDISKTGTEASYGPQTNSDVESIHNDVSPQMEMTVEETAGTSQERSSSPQTDCSLLVGLSKEDGTYRANPVLICEETDDSLTGSVTDLQISELLENVTTSVPSSVVFDTQKQEGDIPVALPRQSSSSPQEDLPAKISELKHFWDKEYTGPRVISARVKEASSSDKVGSPQCDLRTSSDGRGKSKGEAQTSPCKTRSDRSQLRSSGSTGDVQSTWHQHQAKADTEAQERPLSPSKSHDDEVRRSPSKTCHPRVLPRESSSPQRSRLEGSPLKTFPINIDPQTEEHQGKPTPKPRQKKSPSHEAKQTVLTDIKPSTDITSQRDRGARFGNVDSSSCPPPQSKKASEKKLGTFTRLARSFIPQDYQHYLGPQEKAHVPSFHPEKAAVAESDALRDFMGNQSGGPTEGNPPRFSSWIVQNKDGNSSHDTTTRTRSLPHTSSGSELSILCQYFFKMMNEKWMKQ